MAIRNVHAPPKRQGGWQNKVLARVVLEALGYNPSKHFGKITAPVYFRVAMLDHLCPPSVVLDAVNKAGFKDGQIVVQERNVTHLAAHSTGGQAGSQLGISRVTNDSWQHVQEELLLLCQYICVAVHGPQVASNACGMSGNHLEAATSCLSCLNNKPAGRSLRPCLCGCD